MPRPPSPMIVAGRMGSVLDANLAAAKLRGEGINAQVEPTNAFSLTGLDITLNDQGVGVLVPESQAAKAAEVLEEFGREKCGDTPKIGDYEPEPEIVLESRKTLRAVKRGIVLNFFIPFLFIFLLLRIRKTSRAFKAVEANLSEEYVLEVRHLLKLSEAFALLGWLLLIGVIFFACGGTL